MQFNVSSSNWQFVASNSPGLDDPGVMEPGLDLCDLTRNDPKSQKDVPKFQGRVISEKEKTGPSQAARTPSSVCVFPLTVCNIDTGHVRIITPS